MVLQLELIFYCVRFLTPKLGQSVSGFKFAICTGPRGKPCKVSIFKSPPVRYIGLYIIYINIRYLLNPREQIAKNKLEQKVNKH